jgi:hypothetical protein
VVVVSIWRRVVPLILAGSALFYFIEGSFKDSFSLGAHSGYDASAPVGMPNQHRLDQDLALMTPTVCLSRLVGNRLVQPRF